MSDCEMISKSALGFAIGIGSLITIGIGLAIYFDRKRCQDFSFKKLISINPFKRRRVRRSRAIVERISTIPIPNLRDFDAVLNYFFAEVEIGEDFLDEDDIDNGVEHLCRAIVVCNYPQLFLEIIKEDLPDQVFHLIIERLPAVGQWIHDHQVKNFGTFSPETYYYEIGGPDTNQEYFEFD